MQPDAAAVDFLTDAGDHRREQKDDADDSEGVLVVGEAFGVAQKHHDQNHEHDAQEKPNDLVDGHIGAIREGCYARDEGDADARECKRDRQDCGVGFGREQARGDMRHDEGAEDADRHAEGLHVERLSLVDCEHREHQDDERRRDQKEDKLNVAPCHAASPLPELAWVSPSSCVFPLEVASAVVEEVCP